MTLTGIREGDIIRCDVRGDQFLAFADERNGRELIVRPISNGRGPVRIVTARQVVDHWRKSKRKARAA